MPRLPMRARAAGRALLALICLAVFQTSAADALERLDFEQPYFFEQIGWQCKDHAVVKHDGLYHVFYIQSLPPDGHWMRKEQWFGHITSPDLRHWTQHPPVLSVDVPDPADWESEFVWAPKIIADPNSSDWLMYYTGANYDVAQQMGLASSFDLYNWYRYGGNPIYAPGAWAQWEPDQWSNCRDPEIYFEPDSSKYYLFNTASIAPDTIGTVSVAESENLSAWTDLGPLLPNSSSKVMESVQFLKRAGSYHLLYTEQGDDLISHISSPDLLTGWSVENRNYVHTGHACEVTPDSGGLDIWSHHRGIALRDGTRFYLRFGRVDFDTADGVPDVIHDVGFTDDWTIVFGDAFNYQPTWGDNPYERGEPPTGMEGNSYVATYEFLPHPGVVPLGRIQGNAPTGAVRSVNFDLTGDRISLKVGGGNQPGLTFVALVRASDQQILFWETGEDSHQLSDRLWDITTLTGETVFVVIADLSTVEWGHIAVDSIEEYLLSGQDPITPTTPMSHGPDLYQVLTDAGYGWTQAPAAPPAASVRLLAPYPNPFNPRTRLRYELARGGRARLDILDAQGRRVRRLLDAELAAGPGYAVWDARDDGGRTMASGVYFAALSLDGERAERRKLMLVK